MILDTSAKQAPRVVLTEAGCTFSQAASLQCIFVDACTLFPLKEPPWLMHDHSNTPALRLGYSERGPGQTKAGTYMLCAALPKIRTVDFDITSRSPRPLALPQQIFCSTIILGFCLDCVGTALQYTRFIKWAYLKVWLCQQC